MDEMKQADRTLVALKLPAGWTLAGLVAGLAVGLMLAGTAAMEPVLAVAQPAGKLWLRALQMTIIPLVAALLVMGISHMLDTARAGQAARRTLGWICGVLIFSGVASVIAMPALLEAFPIPASAVGALGAEEVGEQVVPPIGDFIASLVAPNIIAAAAETAMLPLVIFFVLFAVAISRIAPEQRETLLGFFHALGNAMLVIIGWVLWAAPVGVFALAIGVAAQSGGGAIAALGHYILTVSAMGGIVLIAAYVLAAVVGRQNPVKFFRSMIPAQAVALSTQSSLASLPAMLDSARRLGLRETTAEFVLPLAVAIFRATSPAMNLAVAIYVAYLTGVELTPQTLAVGIAVALVISIGSVSLPGSISFVVSIGPIALAMGVPIEALALLVAVEMLPDIMRTVANVTMNVAVTSAVDQSSGTQAPTKNVDELQP